MLLKLRPAWHGTSYELLTRNCLHFCDALANGLGVPAIPAYLNRMAYGADAVANFANSAYEQVTSLLCWRLSTHGLLLAAFAALTRAILTALLSRTRGICTALPMHACMMTVPGPEGGTSTGVMAICCHTGLVDNSIIGLIRADKA